jgi:hypothetical protein
MIFAQPLPTEEPRNRLTIIHAQDIIGFFSVA